MYYIEDSGLLESIFELIELRYAKLEEVPSYRSEGGFVNLCATLNRVKDDLYYPTLFSKSAYLFININKGHFFSNGNKRLSIVVLFFFLVTNNLLFKGKDKQWYRERLEELFPECSDIDFEDFPDFTAVDFCAYHLAIRTAASGKYNISHPDLKNRIEGFLKDVTERIEIM